MTLIHLGTYIPSTNSIKTDIWHAHKWEDTDNYVPTPLTRDRHFITESMIKLVSGYFVAPNRKMNFHDY